MSDLPTLPVTAAEATPAEPRRTTPETAGKYAVAYHLEAGGEGLVVIGGIETPERYAAKSPRAARRAAIEDEHNHELRMAVGLVARADGVVEADAVPPLVVAVPAASFVAVPAGLETPPPKLVV